MGRRNSASSQGYCMREIGSEFHKMPVEAGRGLVMPRPGSLVFSGRTAIEAVLKKIPEAHSVLVPSYCCDSMIAPFKAAGIDVSFYAVNWSDGLKIDLEHSADVILWCNYFGYQNDMPNFEQTVIEDITHSFLSEKQFHEGSDYLVASLRKWEPVYCGGYCSVDAAGTAPSKMFIEGKSAAMDLKTEYLQDLDVEKKPRFLQMFSENNHWLADNYSGLSIDSWSKEFLLYVDVENQRNVRRQNAHVLYEGLKGKVCFLFPEEKMDCPLFVPVLLENRDKVRIHLTENKIYCPVHWPKPDGAESNIYDMELSLICDQRYGVNDMERIVSVLSEVI